LYFSASTKKSTQSYLYRALLKGGGLERITPKDQPGTHSYNVSPDGVYAVHTYSRFDQPPASELLKLPEHKVIKSLTDNKKLKEKLGTLKRPASEFLQIDIGEGVMLDASCIRPADFDASKKYPVLFHVYGEPHGQTVRDVWGGRTMMWHWMLAQKGCIVVSVDNRGTLSPRGREFRKAVYKKVGSMTAADQAAAVRALLKKWSYLDPQRVGIWGWSGGGTSTLNALLQYPDLYQTGVSVAPVPNLRFYDSIYEERYMGLPDENQEGYRKGSAVTHAANLKGNLLIVHGTGDDNVHYQGTEALINELIANNKQFRMMSYPNRSHGISEGKNTTRHLFALLTSFLEEKLIRGGPEAAK
jgi:dipeptidyl-peptidase-4